MGLSTRARNADSLLRNATAGLPLRRTDSESLLLSGAQVAVRYWGGDSALTGRLRARGVQVVQIEDASDFAGVRRNVRTVAAALGRASTGERLIARMDRQLADSRGAWKGARALYLTSGGGSAGPGTLIDAMLVAAGLTNVQRRPGYSRASLESLVLNPPRGVVAAYFDRRSLAASHWSPGGSGALGKALFGHVLAVLPASLAACPAWFAGDAVQAIAARAPGRSA